LTRRRERQDSPAEHRVYVAVLLVTVAAYLFAGFFVRDLLAAFGVAPETIDRVERSALFGCNQLRHLGLPGALAWLAVTLLAVFVYRRQRPRLEAAFAAVQRRLDSSPAAAVAAAALAVGVFWLLRSHFLNPDGLTLAAKLQHDVPLRGAHVTHDEMWELYLHSRFWFYTNRLFGWSVELSYQVLAAVAGGAFVFVLLRYARRIQPRNPLAFFLLVATGGFMQLFFGDVENYSLTAVVILGYFYASALYLSGHLPLVVPSALLATAMTFHLLAGFLIPSLLVLVFLDLRSGRGFRPMVVSALAFVAILGLTLTFFHFRQLPIRDLFHHSHAFGQGSGVLHGFAVPSIKHLVQQANLLLLLVPAVSFLGPLLVFRRIEASRLNLHLAVAAASMLFFQLTWKPGLGVYGDWNLFANAAVPLSLLIWHNVLRIPGLEYKAEILIAGLAIFSAHSYSWILSNHLHG
jgi:hypothetical protein